MNAAFEELYKKFLADIEESKLPCRTEKEQVEQCFWTSKKYWDHLKDHIRNNGFESEATEIDFFRNVKPAFTSYIEYYVLLSEALHSVPKSSPTDPKEIVVNYWKHELDRSLRFNEKSKVFIQYYHSDSNDMDDYYFLRRNNNKSTGPLTTAPVYEEDTEFYTNGDPVLRSYLAYKKYNLYVTTELSALQASETI